MPLIYLYQVGLFTAYNVKQNSKIINKAGILAFITEFQSYQERLYSKLKPHGQSQLLEFASDWFSHGVVRWLPVFLGLSYSGSYPKARTMSLHLP